MYACFCLEMIFDDNNNTSFGPTFVEICSSLDWIWNLGKALFFIGIRSFNLVEDSNWQIEIYQINTFVNYNLTFEFTNKGILGWRGSFSLHKNFKLSYHHHYYYHKRKRYLVFFVELVYLNSYWDTKGIHSKWIKFPRTWAIFF